MNRRIRFRALAAGLLLLGGACGGDDSADPAAGAGDATGESRDAAGIPGGRISIATGGTSGVYFVLGGGLAKLITDEVDGVEATAEVTSGSVDNLLLLDSGDTDVAFALADTAADAVNGEASFDRPLEVRALARLYSNATQVVTTAGSGIESVADLSGKRVSVGAPGSGTEVIANRILAVAGVDVKREQLGLGESVSAMRDGVIDAFFWSAGLPASGITDLASTEKVRLLPLDDILPGLQQAHGDVYQPLDIPAGSYGIKTAVPSFSVANYLVVRADMNDALAERITRLLFEDQDRLAAVHPEGKNYSLATARDVAPLKLHPGAVRYYDKAR